MDHKRNTIGPAIESLQNRLIEAFDENSGSWCGRQWMSVSLTAEYLLLRKYLGIQDDYRVGKALREIEKGQNADGGFPAYEGGPSEPSISSICQLAFDLYRKEADPKCFEKAKNYLDNKVIHRQTLLIARFYRFLFGRLGMKGLPQIRPELIVWPKGSGISIYDVASWVRSWLVPISILWHFEKYNPAREDRTRFHFYLPFLRKKSMRMVHRWILNHQDKDGSWYGVFSSTMISMMAMYRLGYTMDDPVMQKAMNFIHSLQDESNHSIRQQPFLGPVWDTAYSVLALDGSDPGILQQLSKAKGFLLDKQVNQLGDWSVNNKQEPGAWPFEYENRYYPDVDDTAIVLQSLHKLGLNQEHAQVKKGLEWLLSMQNKDGSWAAFDKNNNKKLPVWYLNFRKYYIGDGPGLIADKGTADLTAHVIETLSFFDFEDKEKIINKGLRWLIKAQEKDGSWFGRWGLCYLYGTTTVIKALSACGVDSKQPYIQQAIRFLSDKQNEDGGFGEVPEAYFDPSKKGRGSSDPTQTAWVVMALLAVHEQRSETVEKAISYLVDSLQDDGSYAVSRFHAVAAPPLYQRYELYPVYFPLMALKDYREKDLMQK